MSNKKTFTVTDNEAHNALVAWLLDTDADSVAGVLGPIFGVKVEAKCVRAAGDETVVEFECTPIKGQYLKGLDDYKKEGK